MKLKFHYSAQEFRESPTQDPDAWYYDAVQHEEQGKNLLKHSSSRDVQRYARMGFGMFEPSGRRQNECLHFCYVSCALVSLCTIHIYIYVCVCLCIWKIMDILKETSFWFVKVFKWDIYIETVQWVRICSEGKRFFPFILHTRMCWNTFNDTLGDALIYIWLLVLFLHISKQLITSEGDRNENKPV